MLNTNLIYLIGFKHKLSLNPKTQLQFIIRKIAKIEYNHVGVLYFDQDLQMQLVSNATSKGVKSQTIQDIIIQGHFDEYQIFIKKTPITNLNQCFLRIKNIEHKKYDYRGLLQDQLLLNTIGIQSKKESDATQTKFYCYESAAYIFGFKNAFKVKPKDFMSHFQKVYFKV